jgi:hypothetical protein
MKDRGSVEDLIKRLQQVDPGRDPWSVQQLAKALGEKGSKRAVPQLLELLDITGGTTTGDEIISALGAIGDLKAVDPLIKQLQGKSSSAAWVLGDLGDKRAVEPLIEALSYSNDFDWKDSLLRGNAARSLGILGDERAIKPLEKALSDPKERVRKEVMQALVKLGVSNVPGLDEWVLEDVSPQEEGKRLVELGLVKSSSLKQMHHRGIRRVLSVTGKKIDPAIDELVMVGAEIDCGVCINNIKLPDPFKLCVRGFGDKASCYVCECPGCSSEHEISGHLTESSDGSQECWVITRRISISPRFKQFTSHAWPDPRAKKISVEPSAASPEISGQKDNTLKDSNLKSEEVEKMWGFNEAIFNEEKEDLVLTDTVHFENLKKMSVYKILPLQGQEIGSSDMLTIDGILKCSVCQKESPLNFKLSLQGFFKAPSQHSVKCQYCSSSDMIVGVTTEVKKGEKNYWLLVFREIGPPGAFGSVPQLKVKKLSMIKQD